MHHLSLPPEAVRATRAAARKHRRPDGTFDHAAIAVALVRARATAAEMLDAASKVRH